MDEPGLGRMFAPFDWVAERFYDLPRKAAHFQSGLDYEIKKKITGMASTVSRHSKGRSFTLGKRTRFGVCKTGQCILRL